MKYYCAGNGQLNQMSMAEKANTLDCMHDQQFVVGQTVENISGGGIADTLTASCCEETGTRNGKEREVVAIENEKPKRKYIVRRLTPTECARLQGFPDWWTDGADGSDSSKYKLWGNGIALPCAEDVIGRCAEELRKEADDGNLVSDQSGRQMGNG